jgi:hypothetical protein
MLLGNRRNTRCSQLRRKQRIYRPEPIAGGKVDFDRLGGTGPILPAQWPGVGTPLAGYSLGQVDVVTPAPLFLNNLFRYVAGVLLSASDFVADRNLLNKPYFGDRPYTV